MRFIRKYPYISTIIVSIIMGTIIWLYVPAYYCARTTISDEYRETDLAVGLDVIKANMRMFMEQNSSDINSIELYGKALETTDYAINMAQVELHNGLTYAQYINEEDTLKEILSNVRSAVIGRQQILKVEFRDKDPLVAYTMLNASVEYLEELLNTRKKEKRQNSVDNQQKKHQLYLERFLKAQKDFNEYASTHININKPSCQDTLDYLANELSQARSELSTAKVELTRAKMLVNQNNNHFTIVEHATVPTKKDSNVFGYIMSCVVLGLIFVKGLRLLIARLKEGTLKFQLCNIFSPWNITILHWIAILVLIWIDGDLLYPLTERFWISLAIWGITLPLTAFLTFNLLRKKDSEETPGAISPNVNIKWFYFFLAVTLVFTPLCIKRIMDTVSMFAGENMMYNIRMLVVEGETGWGVLSYSFVINKALLICALWARKKVGIIPTIIVLMLMFMSAFALMDKGSLLFIFLTLGYVLYEKGIISLRSIFLTGGALLGIFFLLTLLRNFTDGQGEIQSDELTFVDFFAMYVLSAPVAYGYMPPDIGLQFGSRSLTLLYLILGKLSGNFHVESLVQEFMEVPIPTNLYTIMQPFYLDFGQWGVFIFALLYGVASGWCYAIYKSGNSWGCAAYTFMLYNLVTQYGSEHILLSPIITIQLLVILYLLTQNKIKITFLPSKHAQTNT